MPKLYEIAHDFETLYQALDGLDSDDENYEDLLQGCLDTLEGIEGDFERKAESVAIIVKRLTYDAENLKAEKSRLAARQKTCENSADRLKHYLMDQMLTIGRTKIEAPRAVLSIRQNPESVKVIDLETLRNMAAWCWKPRKWDESELDKTAIKEHIKAGETISGVELTRTQSLLIK